MAHSLWMSFPPSFGYDDTCIICGLGRPIRLINDGADCKELIGQILPNISVVLSSITLTSIWASIIDDQQTQQLQLFFILAMGKSVVDVKVEFALRYTVEIPIGIQDTNFLSQDGNVLWSVGHDHFDNTTRTKV
ncbi:hypothetical protein PSTG_14572 [Puccinia striiformis f. sp. tritici PST-78]|uniref:Uncharacterized protein n=1 Tax=Puccinia striiformis f. sp. tritici PST-78 TaxID=1165861 RepID=A0A0L0UZ78_9BASI|nr:hypothetical protein PSTG_14572 [Puccinia striiformis f. sp. tritici PST-78]